jgi:hypothetical protein
MTGSNTIFSVYRMSYRTSTNDLFAHLSTIRAVLAFATNHPGAVFRCNPDTTKLVVTFDETGMVFVAFVCFQQGLQWNIESFWSVHFDGMNKIVSNIKPCSMSGFDRPGLLVLC